MFSLILLICLTQGIVIVRDPRSTHISVNSELTVPKSPSETLNDVLSHFNQHELSYLACSNSLTVVSPITLSNVAISGTSQFQHDSLIASTSSQTSTSIVSIQELAVFEGVDLLFDNDPPSSIPSLLTSGSLSTLIMRAGSIGQKQDHTTLKCNCYLLLLTSCTAEFSDMIFADISFGPSFSCLHIDDSTVTITSSTFRSIVLSDASLFTWKVNDAFRYHHPFAVNSTTFSSISRVNQEVVSEKTYQKSTSASATKGFLLTVTEPSSFTYCIFNGTRKSTSHLQTNDDVCSWSGSLVDVTGTEANFSDCTFVNGQYGALSLSEGAQVRIEDGLFEDNNPGLANYPSARRNILCSSSSSLNLVSLKGGDGQQYNTSLWIKNDATCTFTENSLPTTYISPFFIPTITEASIEEAVDKKTATLTIKGTVLLPCSLTYTLTADDSSYSSLALSSSSDTLATATLSGSTLANYQKAEKASITVVYTHLTSSISTAPYDLKSSKKLSSSSSGDTGSDDDDYKWALFGFIAAAAVAVILVIVLVVLCICCRGSSSSSSSYDDSETDYSSTSKASSSSTTTTSSSSGSLSEKYATHDADEDRPKDVEMAVVPTSLSSSSASAPQSIRVKCCSAPYTEQNDPSSEPLLSFVHRMNPQSADSKTPIPSEWVLCMAGAISSVLQCIGDMTWMGDSRVWNIVQSFSPSSLLVSSPPPKGSELKEGKGVYLVIEGGDHEHALRYLSPELSSPEDFSSLSSSDKEKSLVFTLGLILAACLTGIEPFAPSSDSEAHSSIQSHALPSFETIESKKIVKALKKMLDPTPSERPSIKDAAAQLRKAMKKIQSKEEEGGKEQEEAKEEEEPKEQEDNGEEEEEEETDEDDFDAAFNQTMASLNL